MTTGRRYFTREEAADEVRVSLKTIERAIGSGALKAKRTSTDPKTGLPSGRYRISRDALDAWFDNLPDA